MVAEHMRPNGLAQGYYCFTCGQSCNMYATGHGKGVCTPNPELVKELVELNRGEAETWSTRSRGDQQQPALDPRKETPGGRWIKRDVDVHRCNKPYLKSEAPLARSGDKWECNGCHKVYEVIGFDSGMQHDPFPTVIRWKEVKPVQVTAWRDQ